jgi:glutathione S-transferase
MQSSLSTSARTTTGAAARLHRRPASAALAAAPNAALPSVTDRPTLFDVPVSNNGARVRYVIYSQGLDVDIQPPTILGGLRSEAYLALNPQGKMPLLQLPSPAGGAGAADSTGLPANAVYESEVVVDYLLDTYCPPGTLRARDPAARARASLATRVHDMYVTTAQGAMYKGGLSPEQRSAGLKQLSQQLDALERIVAAGGGGPFIAGAEITTADAALAPTFEFMTFILPKYFGWKDVFAGRPALKAWWQGLRGRDAHMARVLDEVNAGLRGWESKDRWGELKIKEQVAKGEAQYAF